MKLIDILKFILNHASCTSDVIHIEFAASISNSTVKRILTQLLTEKYILTDGKGTKYFISPSGKLLNS